MNSPTDDVAGMGYGLPERIDALVADHWLRFLLLGASVLQLAAILRAVVGPGRPTLTTDSALYEHGGWYMASGGVPYVDMWDVKPPLAFEVPAILSLISGGDPFVLHFLAVLTTGSAMVATVALVGAITFNMTGDEWAGLLAGGAVCTFPFFYYYAGLGFRPKILVLCLGMGSMYLQQRGRYVGSGACAAACAGLWQGAVIFPLVILVMNAVHGDRNAVMRATAGMAAVTLAVVLPIVVLGGAEAMFLEAVVIPIALSTELQPLFTVVKAIFLLAFGSAIVGVGAYGVLTAALDVETGRWFAVLLGWFALAVFFNLDYYPDVFVVFTVAAVGTGVLGADRSFEARSALVVALALVAVLNGALMLGVGPFAEISGDGYRPNRLAEKTTGLSSATAQTDLPDPNYEGSKQAHLEELFWTQTKPEYCHYRFAEDERQWLAMTGRTFDDPCGELPDDWPSLLL